MKKMLLAIVALVCFSCKKPEVTWTTEDQYEDSGTSSNITVVAQQLFSSRCVPCHGANGDGNGVAANALNPRPRNFHDHSWQASVTDQQIERTIQLGGEAVGKSPLMPSNPDLSEDQIHGLMLLIRGFRN